MSDIEISGFEVATMANQMACAALEQDWGMYNYLLDELSECNPRRVAMVFATEYAWALRSLGETRYAQTRIDTLIDSQRDGANPFERQ
jgi:hypothetical protein